MPSSGKRSRSAAGTEPSSRQSLNSNRELCCCSLQNRVRCSLVVGLGPKRPTLLRRLFASPRPKGRASNTNSGLMLKQLVGRDIRSHIPLIYLACCESLRTAMKPAKIIMASAKHPCIFGRRPGANDNDRVKSRGAASPNTMANLGDQEKKLIDGGVGCCCDLLGQARRVHLLHGMPDLQQDHIDAWKAYIASSNLIQSSLTLSSP
jgi:hypothetical protein